MRSGKTPGIYIFIISALFSHNCAGQLQNQDSIKKSNEIISIEQELMDAIGPGDTSTWKRYLDEQFFIVTEDGTRFTKSSFIKTFHPLPKGFSGRIKVTQPRLVFHGNMAVITYVADEHEFVFGQELHTTYSTINTYYNNGTSWQIMASQVFEIPQLPPPVKVPAVVLQKFCGIYQVTDTVTCSVNLENDTLFIKKKGRDKEALFAETENVFFRLSDTRGRKIFSADEKGNTLMRERRNGEDVTWKKVK